MNPLSTIRQLMSSDSRTTTLASVPETKTIKASELATLNPTSEVSSTQSTASTQNTFGSVLSQLVEDVNSKQIAAAEANQGVLTGQNVSLHQAVITMEEASVSFQLMVEVRNKLLESYQELMRMQI